MEKDPLIFINAEIPLLVQVIESHMIEEAKIIEAKQFYDRCLYAQACQVTALAEVEHLYDKICREQTILNAEDGPSIHLLQLYSRFLHENGPTAGADQLQIWPIPHVFLIPEFQEPEFVSMPPPKIYSARTHSNLHAAVIDRNELRKVEAYHRNVLYENSIYEDRQPEYYKKMGYQVINMCKYSPQIEIYRASYLKYAGLMRSLMHEIILRDKVNGMGDMLQLVGPGKLSKKRGANKMLAAKKRNTSTSPVKRHTDDHASIQRELQVYE